jgi:hypothetical protein
MLNLWAVLLAVLAGAAGVVVINIRRTRARAPAWHEIDAACLKRGASKKKLEAIHKTQLRVRI